MSSSNATIDLITSLNNASNILNRYLPIFIYIFGIVGNLLNVLVLSQRSLRSNTSAIFLLVSSIAGLIVILSGLTSRMMSGYTTDLTLTIGWICKLRNVILYSSRTIYLSMIALAAIDRWLSSSIHQHYRQKSTLKNAWRSMIAILIYTCILNSPIIYCYEANLNWALRRCYGSTYTCRLITDLIYAFGTTLLPLVLMIIFGLLTIKNIRYARSRIQTVAEKVISLANKSIATSKNGQLRARKIDQYLLKMLLIQVTLLVLLTCPHAIQKVYSSFASNPPPQSLQSAIETFILNLFTLFTFIASGMPFYIYTLSGGSVFRNALLNLLKTCAQKILCH
ncbi:unnamed protein product [Rotaria sp. Silwood1]|nr:unnamed protein product [Rotaria sp. Silwood1]CAF1182857.1 unnamed protein product [Rotaria sp. Silwood1]CAF1201910.1 unnamed protein product [Rotaria sp. Silwood1]CAF3457550.1 unnamed protein product [Rotaria sp. Silwood1]CAF3463564.1 unnamed protein product [Rotaria sp. Silwood1]